MNLPVTSELALKDLVELVWDPGDAVPWSSWRCCSLRCWGPANACSVRVGRPGCLRWFA